uniref:Uncharacterized protein n=1 Tax=Aegilops tauschii subsp. strangulata TaxID=200361 RepID=A0A453NLK9_AEGTS
MGLNHRLHRLGNWFDSSWFSSGLYIFIVACQTIVSC